MRLRSTTRLYKQRRIDDRAQEHARSNPKDAGIREGVAVLIASGEVEIVIDEIAYAPDVAFRMLAHRRFQRAA